MDGRRRSPFTLIEILLCFALLTIFGSLAALQGFRSIQEFRYKQSVGKLREELTFVNHLSLSSQVDIHFTLYWDRGTLTGVYFLDDSDRSLDPLLRKTRTFPKISHLELDHTPLKEPMTLIFSPNTRALTQHIVVTVSSTSGDESTFTIS